jgi:hypothetical protein
MANVMIRWAAVVTIVAFATVATGGAAAAKGVGEGN